MTDTYELTLPEGYRRPLSRAWLMTAVIALLVSGIFVILIVASRTPGVEAFFPLKNFFHLAIVVHVDFSVLVWFAAFGAMLWTLTSSPGLPLIAWSGLPVVIGGCILLALAPFQEGAHHMSNYVPVVDNRLFIAGLSVFAIGILISTLHALCFSRPISAARTPHQNVMHLGIYTAVIAIVLTAMALLWSLRDMPEYLTGLQYYEVLFWGAGHILQFAWGQLILVVWLWLASAAGIRLILSPRVILILLILGILPAFLFPYGYIAHEVGSPDHRMFFLWLMVAAGGLATGPLALAAVISWLKSNKAEDRYQRGLRAGLLLSVALFGVGGLLGFLINESNTIIPAHYHGCIVAITLAFMTLALHLMPHFGFTSASPRLMLTMPWVYGIGQMMHIIGLAWSGGHGVQRKTAGADQGLEGLAQIIGMGIMGLGGLVAIIGGILFLVAFAKGVFGKPAREARAHGE